MNNFTELDCYLFGQATHYDIYKKMGAHEQLQDNKKGICFTLWAPNADRVFVIGDFNAWDETANELKRVKPKSAGIFETFIEGDLMGSLYRYLILTKDGSKLYKSDPYANQYEMRPGNASRITSIDHFKWTDKRWVTRRENADALNEPISIYEVHPGSWMRHPGRGDDGFYTYRELAVSLVDYVLEMGYTHIELMGISEYPFDGSWGYQVTGYFAPTSRYGTPEDFAYLVNYCHTKKIGVILDWVPAHFPRDAYGLAEFDGTCLYEYPDPRMGEHPDWGTKIFNYGLNQVKNFLIGSALMWIEHYHVDGLRVDAVASMLYLDYGKKDGQWVANKYGDNKNLDAIEFFRHINSLVEDRNKGIMMIAEESTAWPLVTGSAKKGGLNFNFKWNMGWMHDFLEYMKLDPLFRKYNHHKMTFSMTYNASENYILVLSHDEVVHLKGSMITKMPGYEIDKYANLKVGYTFMFGHPGKKLLFMGQEFAQVHEWDEATELEWFQLANKEHSDVQNFVRQLLHIYQKYSCLYANEKNPYNFEWINADDASRSIFSFVRKSEDGKNNLLFVLHFTPMDRPDYRVGVPENTSYKLILSTDDATSDTEKPSYRAKKQECDGREYSFSYPLSGYGVAVFKYSERRPVQKPVKQPKIKEKKKK
ncbi:MAG: 1,4-alpha-glucan branching protein GlgB [Lachnospiraceae bacterium]